MVVTAVVFDVGETLVDETRNWERAADECRPPGEIAYVGDVVPNDIDPALAAGIVAVHIRPGPWGHLHDLPSGAIRISSLDELPEALP